MTVHELVKFGHSLHNNLLDIIGKGTAKTIQNYEIRNRDMPKNMTTQEYYTKLQFYVQKYESLAYFT